MLPGYVVKECVRFTQMSPLEGSAAFEVEERATLAILGLPVVALADASQVDELGIRREGKYAFNWLSQMRSDHLLE